MAKGTDWRTMLEFNIAKTHLTEGATAAGGVGSASKSAEAAEGVKTGMAGMSGMWCRMPASCANRIALTASSAAYDQARIAADALSAICNRSLDMAVQAGPGANSPEN